MNPIQAAIKQTMDELRLAMHAWLTAALDPGTPVVDENQSTPQPRYPYVSFGFLGTLTKLGRQDSYVHDSTSDTFILRAHRSLTMTVNAHGKPYAGTYNALIRATDILAGVQMQIDDPFAYAKLQEKHFAILGDNGVIDTTVFEDNLWQPRANLDLIIGLSIKAALPLSWIERVEITHKYDANFDGDFEKVFGPFIISDPSSEESE